MNKLLVATALLLPVTLFAQVAPSGFDYDGLKNKAIAESCYHEPCTAVRFMDYRVLDSGSDYSVIKAKVVWGRRDWEDKYITWNHQFSSLFITCSKQQPTLQIRGEVISLRVSPEYGVAGVEHPFAIAYFTACHNATSPNISDHASRFGYNTTI